METHIDVQLVADISKNLGEINSKMSTLCSTLAAHEVRLLNLEKMPSNLPEFERNQSMRDKMTKYLMIALIASISVIVTLTGSASVLKSLLMR